MWYIFERCIFIFFKFEIRKFSLFQFFSFSEREPFVEYHPQWQKFVQLLQHHRSAKVPFGTIEVQLDLLKYHSVFLKEVIVIISVVHRSFVIVRFISISTEVPFGTIEVHSDCTEVSFSIPCLEKGYSQYQWNIPCGGPSVTSPLLCHCQFLSTVCFCCCGERFQYQFIVYLTGKEVPFFGFQRLTWLSILF